MPLLSEVDSSHSTSTTLMCDVCGFVTKQNSEMTRHKQDKHGHPKRGERGSGTKKVTHTVVIVPEGEEVPDSGVRPSRASRRSRPYSVPSNGESSRLSKSHKVSPSPSSRPDSFYAPSSPASCVSSLAPAPSCSNSIFEFACPTWPAMPEPSWDSPADNMGEFFSAPPLNWPSDPTGLDALFCSSQIPRPENPYEPTGIQDYLSSIPAISSPDLFTPSAVEQPAPTDFTFARSLTPFGSESLLPFGVQDVQTGASYSYEQADYGTGFYMPLGLPGGPLAADALTYPESTFPGTQFYGNDAVSYDEAPIVSSSQLDTSRAMSSRGSLSLEEQLEIITAHSQSQDTSSLAPPSPPSDDEQLQWSEDCSCTPDWMRPLFEDTSYTAFQQGTEDFMGQFLF